MDNDDNDYQGQGLHLVGEESSKVSPVLRPFTLPKFDFDVGHIRFDSLVENEVFLGIPGQEDNQWIEDFSRGSSGLEFSSGAADSCSISRHNNVWSEATSLETVEMLLKSVGQEEMVPGESTIQDSDGGGVLPCLTKQMDDRIENVKDANPVVTPVEVIAEFSGMDQSPDVDDGHGKRISEVQQVDQSAYGRSGASSEKGGQAVTKVNVQVEMSYDENQKDTCTIVNESLRDQIQDDPSVPVVEVQDAESLVQDVSLIIGKAHDQIVASDLCHENAATLTDFSMVDHDAPQDNFPVNGEKFNEGSAATCAEDLHPPLLVASSVEMLGKCAAEVTASNLPEPSSLIAVGNSNLQTGERLIEKGTFADNREDNSGTTHAKGAESSVNLVESPVLSGSQIESSQQTIIQTVDLSVLKQSSISVGDDCGVITPGLEDRNDIAVIDCEDTVAADVVPAHAGSGSAYICEELSSSRDVHVHDCGGHSVVIHEKGAYEMPSDSGKLEHDFAGALNGEKMAGSSLGEVAEGNVETTHGSAYDASNKDERDSNLEAKDTSNVSHKAIKDGAPVDSVASEVVRDDVEQKSDQHKQDREMQMEVLTDAKMSPLQVSGDEAFQQCPDSGSKIVVSNNTAVEAVLEVANQPPNFVVAETSVEVIEAEQVAERASVELSDKIELSFIHPESNAKMKEAVETVDVHKDEEPPKKKNLVAASSEVLGGDISAEVEKPNTVSESVDTGPGLPQSNTDEQAGVKDGKVENVPFSDSKELVASRASLNPMPRGVNVASEEEKSFTYDVSPVAGFPEGGTDKGQQSSTHSHAEKRSGKFVDGSPSTPGSSQKDPKVVQLSTSGSSQRDSKVVQEISHESQQTPGKGSLSGASKGPSDRRARRGSAKSGKENARKGTSVKETVPLRQSEIGDRSSVSMGSSGSGLMQLDVGNVERGLAKTGMLLSFPGSSLPDLNTSAPISLLVQQPFTNLQQVQLRAQIFVYGSLIQGVAPDEACMISAFGISDGGRSFWEPIWRACFERLHGQKSHPNSSETPARSGSKASDQANNQGSSQSKVVSTPAGRVSSKSTASVVNPMIPLSSPLWNISTPSSDALPSSNLIRGAVLDYQALSPLHGYPPSTVRNYATHSSSWPSQTVFSGSWVSSAQSSVVDARLSSQPVAETLKLTPIKESSVAIYPAIKNASQNPIAHSGGYSVFSGASSLLEVTKASANAQQSTDKKSRKRKKASASEDPGQITVPLTQTGTVSVPVTTADASRKAHVAQDMSQDVLVARNDAEFASHPSITSHFSTSVAVATASNIVFKSSSDKSLATVSPVSSNDHTKVGNSTFEKRLTKPEDIAKVEEAKLQAEEAAGHAAIAVTHCQNVWCQLDRHKNSGLMSDVEAKVASAAVAIAASASIAKAAAAAAKIASNVALQAKLMVDEALISNRTQNSTQSDLQSLPLPSVVNLGNATPASILKVGDGNTSIIFAAREAARRKIEAASAASRHAENLEAIVKAAELAAEAVSQAGKVVAMGDPLPIAKLVEAGPEDFLKGSKSPSGQGAKLNNILGSISNVNGVQEVSDALVEQSEKPSDKELHTRSQVTSSLPKETSRRSLEDEKNGDEGISASVTRSEKDLRGQQNRRPSDLSKTSGVVPESQSISRSAAYESVAVTLNDTGIKEGCLVEVFKDNGDFTGAWFSANVLSLKGGKASVCYTDLESAEGLGKWKEWVPLEAEGSKPPRIRIPHPMTSMSFEGARKRRRVDARDYTWSIGDRVDAWIENGWQGGVILEKNKKDESTLSIHFPAQGKTSVVKAWHLRPTLTWKDGEWIEWSNFRESLEGDTPQEKRLRVGSPSNEEKGEGKVSKNVDFTETGKTEESRLLPLSANEKIFDIGSTRNENKPEPLRTMRSGLKKEGSKVIFGVPKPGKKRKFMEVSKHYVSDHNSKSNNSHSDSEKLTKYLMPQGSGFRGWKNNSKVDLKEKPVAESNKPKGIKSGKHPNLYARALPQKDNSITSSASSLKDATLADSTVKDATSNDDNESGQQNLTEFVAASNNEEAAEEQTLLSSQASHSDVPRKAAKTIVKSERLKKGKVAPTVGKLTKADAKDKTIPETVEPRRSNRRIQPTSRLLEGLQSSLIISKFPSVSHDKTQKTHSRGLSRGRN